MLRLANFSYSLDNLFSLGFSGHGSSLVDLFYDWFGFLRNKNPYFRKIKDSIYNALLNQKEGVSMLNSYEKPLMLSSSQVMKDEKIYVEFREAERFNFFHLVMCLIFAVSSVSFGAMALAVFFVSLGLLITIFKYVAWFNTVYAATSKRIISSSGVFSRQFKQIPIDKIQNMEVKSHFIYLGAGSLSFDSSGGNGKEIVWNNISDPEKAHLVVNAILNGA